MKRSYYCLMCCGAAKDLIRSSLQNLNSSLRKGHTGSSINAMAASKFHDLQKKDARASVDMQYEEAIKALNGLQSNAAVLEIIRKQRNIIANTNLAATQKYLERVGVPMDKLDTLPVIHLAGTKGKGSTCAFIESILREHGLKTGLYTSPHLVVARERIRINGMPIPKKEFSHYFWEVYDTLVSSKTDASDMPAYFKFLTVLALNIFLKEEVDVAIIEVGIGGEYDCTNVIRRPVVCGITSLDIDHTSLLGDTIEQIAWHKAGIMKNSVPVFTVGQQPSKALQVLLFRAKEKKTNLFFCPPLENYGWGSKPINLGLSGYVQFLNASLALQLAHYFMRKKGMLNSREEMLEQCGDSFCGKTHDLSEEDIYGLKNVFWPGRSQVLKRGSATFYLDGAHTTLSIQSCIDWYLKTSQIHAPTGSPDAVFRILVFNITGDRDHELILDKLFPCNFDLVIFTTNLVTKDMCASSDQANFTVSESKQIKRCENLCKYWLHLTKEDQIKDVESSNGENSDEDIVLFEQTPQDPFEKLERLCLTLPCVQDALVYISCGESSYVRGKMSQEPPFPAPKRLKDASHIQVLVTGSLHLVGGFLAILDPSLSYQSKNLSTGHPPSSIADMVKRKYARSQFSTPGAP